MKNIDFKITGSIYTAAEFEQHVTETENVISTSDIAFDEANLNQVSEGIAVYAAGSDFYIDSGVADAYVLSPVGSRKTPPAYFNGMQVRFRPTNINTGASTVNVNSLGIKNIKLADGSTNPAAGDIDTIGDVVLRYDGTSFIIVLDSPLTAGIAPLSVIPRGYIDGLILSNDTDTDHDIKMEVGMCRDTGDTQTISLGSAIVKRIDANWAAGTGNGGFPSTLTLSNNTWYHFFIIAKPDNTTDAGFDTSLTATNLLTDATGYTKYRRVGSVLTNGSANIIQFVQIENEFLLKDPVCDVNVTNPGTSANLRTLSVPLGIKIIPIYSAMYLFTAVEATGYYIVTSPDQNDTAPSATLYDIEGSFGSTTGTSKQIFTNTSSQIRTRCSLTGASTDEVITTFGWIDNRGKE